MVLGLIVITAFLGGYVLFVLCMGNWFSILHAYENKMRLIIALREQDILKDPNTKEFKELEAKRNEIQKFFKRVRCMAVIQGLYIVAGTVLLVIGSIRAAWLVPMQLPAFAVDAFFWFVFFGLAFVLGVFVSRR